MSQPLAVESGEDTNGFEEFPSCNRENLEAVKHGKGTEVQDDFAFCFLYDAATPRGMPQYLPNSLSYYSDYTISPFIAMDLLLSARCYGSCLAELPLPSPARHQVGAESC